MNAHAWAMRLLEKLDLSHFPIPLRLAFTVTNGFKTRIGKTISYEDADLLIGVLMPVRDRDSGEPTEVGGQMVVHSRELEEMDERYILLRVRDLLHSCLMHELDESILFDGKRIFDPHVMDYTFIPRSSDTAGPPGTPRA